MKFVVERAPLLQALNHLQGVVERRFTIPILGNVLIKAGHERLSLTATDLDIELVETVAAQVVVDGETTAPMRTLYDITRKLREGSQVEFAVEKGALAIRAGRSRFSLPVIDPLDFPIMSASEMPHNFKLPTADLAALIDRTQLAISTEQMRYYLNGIYLHPSHDTHCLRSVATDGHRLARADVDLPEGAEGMKGVIVPKKTVVELRKLIEDAGEEIAISVGATKIRFETARAAMTSKLIDGTFPDYDRVIPTGNDKIIEVGRADFTSAVDRVATIDTGHSRAIRVSLSKGGMILTTQNAERGTAVEELDATYDGDEMAIGFNSRYLLDIAGQIEGDSLRFDLADSGGPALIRNVANERTLYVLMPMRA